MPPLIPQALDAPASTRISSGPPVEAPGLFTFNWDANKAAAESGFYDTPGRSNELRQGRLAAYAAELARITGKRAWDYYMPGTDVDMGVTVDETTFWADLAAVRRRNPEALADVGRDREDYDRRLQAEFQRGEQRRAVRMARGGFVGNLPGVIAGSFTDRITLLTAGVGGGGRGVLAQILRNGAANAAIEVAETPLVALERKAQGRELTAKEAAMNVAGAFGAGVVFDAAGKAAGAAMARGPGVARNAFEQSVTRHWDRLPQGLRDRWLARTDGLANDALDADIAEAIIGPERMTDAERGALSLVRREARDAAASPFVPDGAGLAAHRDMQQQVLARIFAEGDPAARVLNPPSRRTSTAQLRSGTSAAAMAARPAGGTGGRLDGEIVSFFRGKGYSEAQARGIAAGIEAESRSDHNVRGGYKGRALGLGQWLGARRAEVIRRHGERPTKLQQLEFLHEELQGRDAGGKSVLAGKDEADVLRRYITDFMRPAKGAETTGDMRRGMAALGRKGEHWGGGPTIGDSVPAAERMQLQAEIDALHAESARIRERLTGDGEGAPREAIAMAEPDPVPVDALTAAPPAPAPARADADAGAMAMARADDPAIRAEVAPPDPAPRDLTPQLREMVADRARNLNDMDGLARDLGADPQDVRRAMMELVKVRGGGLAMRKKDGAFIRRLPNIQRGGGGGPQDVLEFIAQRGGIRDDEGHRLGLKGISRKEAAAIISPEARRRYREERAAASGSRNWQRMTRRNGPLLRHEGRSLDNVGEALWEAGYLKGADGDRPTTAEVMDYIEARLADGKPRYTMEDMAAGAGEPLPAGGDSDGDPFVPTRDEAIPVYAEWIAREAEETFGMDRWDLDSEFLDFAAGLKYDFNLSEGEAFMRAVNDFSHAVSLDMLDEAGGLRYEDVEYDWPFETDAQAGRQTGADEGWFARYEPVGNDEAAGGGGGADAASGEGPASIPLSEVPREARTAFLDPDGAPAKAQLASLEHDARAMLDAVDPNVAARRKQEVDLKAAAPLRGENRTGQAQDGTMGLGLFDAADQPEFRLDAEGEAMPLRDMLDALDAEEAELRAARDCL